MAEAFVGEIRLFAFGFAPEGWLLCDGQQVSINQYQALYSLLTNVYGGDPAKGYFNLPDLRGRVPTHAGQGPLSTYQFGAKGGTDSRTINAAASVKITKAEQLPAHGHPATFTGSGGG
uniref:phage tail protein n=1 Tax=Massilia oculi TaxID=945844 RepID=UPI0028AFB8C4